ncbi:PQQ-dependent sugar dehydrogenase [Steroidobacter cummioxidans]|uniref:PQQ-dependent sugar dehydrogenase n=1 Tax=Steroidobacter cummioxidans TaxID=1803913 RepID=UPI000E318A43|nr:PQQ-dependent sugar dehydrogenase [Steroidobacter cummioxidans]
MAISGMSSCMWGGLFLVAITASAAAQPELQELVSIRVSDSKQQYWVEQVVGGLSYPTSIAWLPNGDVLIAERQGALRIVRDGRLDPKAISGVPTSYQGLFDGMRDIAVDSKYPSTHRIYLYISEGTFELRYAAVYSARLSGGALQDVRRIFRSKEGVGGGAIGITSRMILMSDGTLLLAVAEGRELNRAQQLDSHFGKILRINSDGSVPPNNPFINVEGALPEIYSLGHRVPLGLFEDTSSALLWETEAGPRGGDELNLIKPASNYGWPKASWGFSYLNTGAVAPAQTAPDVVAPIVVWTPSVTPSAITRFRGATYPSWDGDYFVGNLGGEALMRLRIDPAQRLVLQERMLLDLEVRIRDVKIGPDNHLYLLTDHQSGSLLRIMPGRPSSQQLSSVAKKIEQPFKFGNDKPSLSQAEIDSLSQDDVAAGHRAFMERCSGCHSIGKAVAGGGIGPNLDGVYNNFMGRKAGFDYSSNMVGGMIQWNPDMLNKFLENPAGLVPGTKMASPPVTDGDTRRKIIGFLSRPSQ